MSRTKQDSEQSASTETVLEARLDPLPVTDKAGVESQQLGPARAFRDTLYTSRTLVMPDGKTLSVAKGLVYAVGDDQYEFLRNHPELEPATE